MYSRLHFETYSCKSLGIPRIASSRAPAGVSLEDDSRAISVACLGSKWGFYIHEVAEWSLKAFF